jgi:hypothetical protein
LAGGVAAVVAGVVALVTGLMLRRSADHQQRMAFLSFDFAPGDRRAVALVTASLP